MNPSPSATEPAAPPTSPPASQQVVKIRRDYNLWVVSENIELPAVFRLPRVDG
jgi:hypothetical protein